MEIVRHSVYHSSGWGNRILDAIGRFEGTSHICISANAALRALSPVDPVGLPAREVWIDYDEAQSLMDLCLQTGRAYELLEQGTDGTTGVLVILPRYRHGVVVGVTIGYRPVPLPVPEPESPRLLRSA